MSLETERKRSGREPFAIIEWDLDYCSLTYGTAPCTAAGSTKCYNTRNINADCQDIPNFTSSIKTHSFCTNVANHPQGLNSIPCLVSVSSVTDGEITPGKGMGERISRKIILQDMPYHDRNHDKYWNERTYDAESQGTLFGKLLACNPYHEGSVIRIKSGYLVSPFDPALLETRTYVVNKVERNKNSQVVITVTDFLRLADNDKAQCPTVNTGVLAADMVAGAATLTLSPAGIGNSEYSASGRARINDQLVDFTRVNDVMTLTHGIGGTSTDDHDAGDTVQECKVWTDTNVIDITYELLNTYVGIDAAYLPLATDWATERNRWMNASKATATISEPEGVFDLLTELCEQFQFNIWWDDKNQKVQLKANMPLFGNAVPETLTEKYHMVEDSISSKDLPKNRISQVWVLYNPKNLVETDENRNYRNWFINPVAENLYLSEHVRLIKSRWIQSEGQASALAGRLLNRFKNIPKRLTFNVDAKDGDITVGDIRILDTDEIQSVDGSNEAHQVQIVAVSEIKQGDSFRVSAMSSYFSSRYAFITQPGVVDYSSASEDEKKLGAYISESLGVNFSDGTKPYLIP
ncbi:MAG: hypothetical protein OEY29_15780 [Gammaproteobacteria bacterium]|nr:hypothetical protein [Gammaproteobacteria bacterium]